MNLRVGLWRTGMVLNGLVSLLTLAMYGAIEAPSKSSIDWQATDRLVGVIYEAQTPAFRAEVRRYDIKDKVWPGKSDPEIMKQACTQASSAEFKQVCADYKTVVDGLWWGWTKHIFATLFFTVIAGAVAGLLWWCFSWVILGFAEPKDQQPKS